MKLRKLLRKPLASVMKRYYTLRSGGYSVGKAYGARFLFDWRHPIDKKVAFQLYEHEQIVFVMGVLDQVKPDLFIDIGAHAALYSLVLKTRMPQMEVHAFEPDRGNLCQLYANLFVNGLQNEVHVHEFGLSDHSGIVRFNAADETSSRSTRRISDTGNIEIPVKRLDDVLEMKGRTVAIKIDVEGHDCQVVDGAMAFLAANRCFLQIETGGESLDALKTKLEPLGYRWVAELGDHFLTNIESIGPVL